MNIPLFKILTSFGLWIIAVICGVLPLIIKGFNTNKFLISISQCFAGGLFIAIGLIHILPEAHENLEGYEPKNKQHGDDPFPLSYFICLSTFSLILLIDKVLFNNTDIIEEIEHTSVRNSMMRKSILSHKDNDPVEYHQERVSHNMKFALSMSRLNLQNKSDDEEDQYIEIPSEKFEADVEANGNLSQKNSHLLLLENQNESQKFPITENKKIELKNSDTRDQFNRVQAPPHDHKGDAHVHHGHQHAAVQKGASYSSAMFILAAMGIHGLFEGLAYGVSNTEEEVLTMFFAIGAHKWCDSLVVGISFVSAELPYKMSIILTIFLSLFTPMGILIGYFASSNRVLTGIFQAISAGTFLYISCAEILIEEFAIADKKIWKFFMYALGITFVTLMTYFFH